jgi:hypothetical protein
VIRKYIAAEKITREASFDKTKHNIVIRKCALLRDTFHAAAVSLKLKFCLFQSRQHSKYMDSNERAAQPKFTQTWLKLREK